MLKEGNYVSTRPTEPIIPGQEALSRLPTSACPRFPLVQSWATIFLLHHYIHYYKVKPEALGTLPPLEGSRQESNNEPMFNSEDKRLFDRTLTLAASFLCKQLGFCPGKTGAVSSISEEPLVLQTNVAEAWGDFGPRPSYQASVDPL